MKLVMTTPIDYTHLIRNTQILDSTASNETFGHLPKLVPILKDRVRKGKRERERYR